MAQLHPSRSTQGGALQVTLVTLLLIACIVLIGLACVVVLRPFFAQPILDIIAPQSVSVSSTGSEDASDASFAAVGDTTPTAAQEAVEQAQWDDAHRTPFIANYDDVYLNSCVAPADLTGVLFHQASNNYALELDTDLPEADYEKAADAHEIRVNHDQTSGEWLDADALHIWRTSDQTAMDTSIDIGAAAGTVARAPVTGTVVLVRDYMLYDEVPDYEIHIQPDGRKDLDCVMIHTDEPMVKAGDHVEGGLTEVCKVRDIEKDLTDVQLGFFTPEGVGGNHVHVQVNDADYENYRDTRLEGAVKVAA